MRTPLPPISRVVPDNLIPEQLQRTTAYFADLRERHGRPHHELRPGEVPAPRVRHPLHTFDDVMQAVHWRDRQDRQREQAAQALREGQLHEPPDGHPTLPASPASSSRPETRSDDGHFGLGQSRSLAPPPTRSAVGEAALTVSLESVDSDSVQSWSPDHEA